MALRAIDLSGDPYLGVFSKATEDLLFVPPGAAKHLVERMEETLGVSAITVTVAGTRVIGTLLAANRHGVVVGDIVLDEELKLFKDRGLEVFRLRGRQNAAGNVLLVNDKAALVHPRLSRAQLQGIADALAVEVEKGTIAGLHTVGSAAVATAKGVLAQPKIEDDEMEQLQSLFGLDVGIGTINYGSPMIGSGVVANSKGAAFGSPSTGIEKGRVAEALGLI